ncbi:MAG TPA: tungsten formylmethanofuran dehydrogenase [Methylovirgula sp.]|nr:tungsten formylmethanofuran dehydrogenase [Methylovirgula sp.]
MKAFVEGAEVSLETAAAAAARVLEQARQPVIAGLATDSAGARAAILLAERLHGAYDHMASDILLRDIDVLRQAGRLLTTPNDVRLRADCLLLIGPKLLNIWPGLADRLALAASPRLSEAKARKIFWLGPGRGEAAEIGAAEITATPAALPLALAGLRAAVLERRIRINGALAQKLTELAETLRAAHFGAILWSAESIDRLAIEMVQGLATDLNQKTRFTTLPLDSGKNVSGVVQTSGWMTGFPVRTGFGRGYPEHDTWRFNATRMIESDEADAALWISAYGDEAPQWKRQVPMIALARPQTRFPYAPRVRFEVGAPGQDHDAVEYARDIATFTLARASAPSDAPRVADILALIEQNLTKGYEAC